MLYYKIKGPPQYNQGDPFLSEENQQNFRQFFYQGHPNNVVLWKLPLYDTGG